MKPDARSSLSEGFEALDQAVCLFDGARTLVFINSRARDLFDLPETVTAAGLSFDDFIERLRAQGAVKPEMKDAFAGNPARFECERPDDRVLDVRIAPLQSGGVMITLRDVTARYQALRAVGRSERDLQSILDQMVDTFYRVDTEGRLILVSPSVRDLLGYGQEEILGRPLTDVYLNPADREAFRAALKGGGGEIAAYDLPLRHKNGGTVWVSSSARVVRDANGDAVAVEGVARDTTKSKLYAEALQKARDDLTKEVAERTEHLHREIVERRQTEESLRASDERYALALEATQAGIWDYDVTEKRLFLSPRLCRIVGTETPWWDIDAFTRRFVHPDDADRVVRDMIAHLKAETPAMETDYRIAVGGDVARARWVQVRGVAVRNPEGRAYRVVGAITDITERRAMEKALKTSEQRFRDIAKSASDWFWEMDGSLRFTFVSDRFFMISGLARESVLGRTLDDLMADGVVRPVGANGDALRPLADKDSFRDLEFSLPRADGTALHMRLGGRPFFGDEGDFLGYRGVGTDISRQREAEDRARQAQERLRDAIESISEAFVLFDENDRLVAYNSKYPQMYADLADVIRPGVAFDTIARTGVERGIYVDAIGREEEWLRDRLASHRAPKGALDVELSNGRWLRVSERSMPDGGVVSIRTDMTELKLAHKALEDAHRAAEEASRAKSDFLANMSHELRTPLNAIMGFSDTMRAELFGPLGSDKYAEYNEAIHQSGQHLLELIEDVLDVAKIEAGKLEMYDEEMAWPEVFETCLSLVEVRARDGGVTVVDGMPRGLPRFIGDRRRMRQIVLNLMSNAVKFTNPGGEVHVGARVTASGCMVLEVRDTGIGMTGEELARALEPFGQVEGAHSRKYEGTGLGLPLVKGLADNHGGVLEVTSEPNVGTLATVTFPAWRTVRPRIRAAND